MQRFRLDRIPDNLLREPLDFLLADHMRQRKICNALDALSLRPEEINAAEIMAVTFAYLSEDFQLHISDEEIDLFPTLRAVPDIKDGLEDLIDALTRSHAIELSLASDIVVLLREAPKTSSDAVDVSPYSKLLVSFTQCLRRNLAVEDQMLLPLARKHLSDANLDQIGRAMAKRRNIDYPG